MRATGGAPLPDEADRRLQAQRLGPGRCNADLTPGELRSLEVDAAARDLLTAQHRADGLSGRGHDRVLRVARTIADLAGAEAIGETQIGEALGLRRPV